MARLNYLLICETVLIDEQQRNTLVNIYSYVETEEFPATAHKITIAFGIFPDPGDIVDSKLTVKVELFAPSGKINAKGEGEATVTPLVKNVEPEILLNLDLGGKVVFKEAGDYLVKLSVNGEYLAERTLVVREKKKARGGKSAA